MLVPVMNRKGAQGHMSSQRQLLFCRNRVLKKGILQELMINQQKKKIKLIY